MIDHSITPAFTTIRQWILKFGLYKLNRPKDKTCDWIHIIDTTIQMGAQKAVLVLGIRLDGSKESLNPTFKEVEPLVLKTVNSCPGEVIKEALESACEKTGAPAVVLSDEGSEMNRGARLLSSEVPVVHLHDCLHKVSNLLKSTLKMDDSWAEFKSKATALTQSIKLSTVAHLIPPKQRAKDRLMSSTRLVEWGIKLISFLESKPNLPNDLLAHFSWIMEYQEKLREWLSMQEMAKVAIKVVLDYGYNKNTCSEWNKKINRIPCDTLALQILLQEIESFLEYESNKVPENQTYPGCSSIIESVFGKFKFLEGQFCGSGLTQLILALPALVGSMDLEEVEKAMLTVSKEDVEEWLNENLGQTYLGKRRMELPELTLK